jgi:hypothetical protein
VLRAFSTLEGIGKTLDPGYQFSEVAQPYASVGGGGSGQAERAAGACAPRAPRRLHAARGPRPAASASWPPARSTGSRATQPPPQPAPPPCHPQELLELQDARTGQRLLLQQLQQQATEMGQAAAAMPLRIARINDTLEQLESGDLRLRVRVLEAERAARRSGVLQGATMNTVAAVGLLNLGAQLALAQLQGPAAVCLGLSSVFAVLMVLAFRRVQRLDKFEKEVRGG